MLLLIIANAKINSVLIEVYRLLNEVSVLKKENQYIIICIFPVVRFLEKVLLFAKIVSVFVKKRRERFSRCSLRHSSVITP